MTKPIKSFMILLLCFTLFVALVACGSNQTANTTTNGSSEKSSSNLSQGVTDSEILVGHLGPQTGAAAIYDLVRAGMHSYFNYVNENGGVNGRKLKLIAYDDEYQPNKTVQLIKRLEEEDKVFAMAGNPCTPCNKAVKQYVEEKGIPIVGISSGSSIFVNPPLPNYFAHIMNYNVEGRIYFDYIANQLKAKKVFVSYQNDDSGKDFLTGIHTIKENYKEVEIVGEVPHLATDVDFSGIAQQIKNTQPDAVIMFSTPKPAASLKKEMYKIGLKGIPYIVSAVGGNDTNLYKLAGEDVWTGSISSTSIIAPDLSDDPKMKLFVERFKKDYPKQSYTGVAQWGWAIGQIFTEAVKRCGDNLTRENLIAQLETFNNWDGSLYPSITYSKDNHYGNTTLYITEAKDGKIVPITGQITYDPKTGKIIYN